MTRDSKPLNDETSTGDDRHILLAEDDPEMRRLVADALRKLGHRVIEASDGAQLLRRMADPSTKAPPDQGKVALIVTDVRMPGGSGLDILEILRSARLRTPVIIMTAFGDSDTRARAERLGAIMLDKPFRIELLMRAVRTLLV